MSPQVRTTNTQIAYKSTNHFMYIHETSYHPHSTYKSVVKGEALRIVYNCSDKAQFKLHLANLVRHLRARKFPRTAIKLAKSVVFNDELVFSVIFICVHTVFLYCLDMHTHPYLLETLSLKLLPLSVLETHWQSFQEPLCLCCMLSCKHR